MIEPPDERFGDAPLLRHREELLQAGFLEVLRFDFSGARMSNPA